MKEWAYSLILCSTLTLLCKAILPNGEKSPFHAPMRFLLALVMIVAVFSPLFDFLSKSENEGFTADWGAFEGKEALSDPGRAMLEACAANMQEAAATAFPEAEFSLRVEAGEDMIPRGVYVLCESEDDGCAIAAFLQENFSLLTTYEKEG